MKNPKYFLVLKKDLFEISLPFENINEVYSYIIEQELQQGTYKLYKVERIINEDI